MIDTNPPVPPVPGRPISWSNFWRRQLLKWGIGGFVSACLIMLAFIHAVGPVPA